MPNTLTPNMSLILPTVGQEPGPNWALDINSSFSLIDQHNHSSGNGVQINPSGLNLNSDLTFLGNNATNLKSVRFSAQLSPLSSGSDIGCVYVSGADLYYNDTLGNQVRLTISGGVNGTPGNISGLIAPASVTYVPLNQTYIFQSSVNTSGSLDSGPIIIRNNTASSNGITITPPTPLTSNYTITLPTNVPASQGIVEMNSSGVVNVSTHSYQSLCPIASIIMFAGSSAPTGWLFCDGSVVSQTTYSGLFSIVGTLYNIGGEGAGNFRLPDMRRRVPMGAGGTGSTTIGNALGNSGGAEDITLDITQIPSHDHGGLTGSSTINWKYYTATPSSNFAPLVSTNTTPGTSLLLQGSSHNHTIPAQGGGASHSNIQPSLVLNYIIKY